MKHQSLEYRDHSVTIDDMQVECDLCICCTGAAKLTLPLNGVPIQGILGNGDLIRGMLDPNHPRILLQHPLNFSPSVKMAWLCAHWIAQYITREQLLESGGVDVALEGWHWYWEGRTVGDSSQRDPLDGWWVRLNHYFGRGVLEDLSDWAPGVVDIYRADCQEMDESCPSEEAMERFDASVYKGV